MSKFLLWPWILSAKVQALLVMLLLRYENRATTINRYDVWPEDGVTSTSPCGRSFETFQYCDIKIEGEDLNGYSASPVQAYLVFKKYFQFYLFRGVSVEGYLFWRVRPHLVNMDGLYYIRCRLCTETTEMYEDRMGNLPGLRLQVEEFGGYGSYLDLLS